MPNYIEQPGHDRKKGLFIVFFAVCLLSIGFLLAACKGDQGPAGPAGPPGQAGPAGPAGPLAPGVERELNVALAVSKPANGTHFVAGEQPVLTITLKDQMGRAFNRAEDFTQLRIMAAGPIETQDTITALKLLKASGDRSQEVHHYIDLKTNADVQVSGNVLTYKFQAVSDEKPGTYTASVWAVLKANPFQQAISLGDFQVGTATVQKQIVEKEKCASCHLGADSGKFYLHHIDQVTQANPAGNFAIDQAPVTFCKTCHNNEGYAAYVSPTDGKTRIPDPIVKRVHGVHYGEDLKNPLNTDPKNGVFMNYTGVVFPANVKNCTTCHVDDRWKTKPSRLACGACHDAIDWATGKSVAKGAKDHGGGPQANDAACASCHTPDTGGVKPISVAHKASQPMNEVAVSMTAPRNGKFYVAGEAPVVSMVIKDDKGSAIDHTKVDETTFSTASFLVYGPRYLATPVLTNAAKNGNSKLRVSTSSSIPAAGTPTK
ncbi:MAG: hypothetical protein HYX87_06900, partial [Chloroflexi bacterium]|nr:hypothetical protein [Chloroflexota bacterium]